MACSFDREDQQSQPPKSRPAKSARVMEDRNAVDTRFKQSGIPLKNGGDGSPVPAPDFLAAAEEARVVAAPGCREEMIRRAVQAWAVSDPAAALAWAGKLPDRGESENAMIQVCTQVAESDPASAIRLAIGQHLDEAPGDLLGTLTAGWAARDLSGAREWVSGQAEGELRDKLMERIVFEYAKADPARAACLVTEQMRSGESQDEAVVSVLHQWARVDLDAARAWVELFPEGDLRDRVTRELAAVGSYGSGEDDK
jgi:hypothetical protein